MIVTGPFSGKVWGAGQQDTYHLAKLLKEIGHLVYVVSYDYNTNLEFVDKFRKAGVEVFIFSADCEFSLFRNNNFFKNLISWLDPATHPFLKLCANKDFINLFEEIKPDAVMGVQTFTSPVLIFANKKGTPSVLRSQNIEFKHHMDMLRGRQLLNPLNYILFFLKYIGELCAARYSSFIFTISHHEFGWYKKINSKTGLLPLCSLYEKIQNPFGRVAESRSGINLFYAGGTYNILPHLKGVELLVEKIMPEVLLKKPGVFKLHIFGSKLPQRLINKCDGISIIYRGYVEDYEVALKDMDVGVFPTFTGRGMKQKIFEAICGGFPVVAPRKALGGYPLKDGEDILIAGNTVEFTDKIIQLKERDLRVKISRGAFNFTEKHFNKSNYTAFLEKVFE